jgi:hypothetical protein
LATVTVEAAPDEADDLQTPGPVLSGPGGPGCAVARASHHAISDNSRLVFCPLLRKVASTPAGQRIVRALVAQLGAAALHYLAYQDRGPGVHAVGGWGVSDIRHAGSGPGASAGHGGFHGAGLRDDNVDQNLSRLRLGYKRLLF